MTGKAGDTAGTIWGKMSAIGFSVGLATLVLDQANKWWLFEVFEIAGRGRIAVTPFLDLIYVKNIGVSYGLLPLEGMGGQYLLAAFAVVVAAALWVWLARVDVRLKAVALGLLIGGALSNAIDRVVLGGVADFYSLHVFRFYWYIFNLADVAIVAGAALLLYESIWLSRKKAPNGS